MRIINKCILGGILSLSLTNLSFADPWFTGPILAPAGHTIPRGHTNFEMYGFDTVSHGIYSRFWRVIHTPGSESLVADPIFTHGLTDKMDIQYAIPYIFNRNQGVTSHRVGDASVTLGYQLMEQKGSLYKPDLRIALQEVLPTGRFQLLNALNNGADATGLGSYQTGVALNFQHLRQLGETHYLRTRLSLSYLYTSDVNIMGLSSFGGSPNTNGVIDPGNLSTVDLAGELTLTQNWVAVMEAYYAKRTPSRFRGFLGTDVHGMPAMIGHGNIEEITLAPAVEYNFSPTIGLIAGPWFTVAGRETSQFISYVVALNAYW